MEIIYEGSGSLSLEEQETTINYCRTDTYAEVWTSDRTVMTRLGKLCKSSPDNYQIRDIGKDRAGVILSKTYRIKDKGLISFKSKKRVLNLTEEQRAEMAERARRLNG